MAFNPSASIINGASTFVIISLTNSRTSSLIPRPGPTATAEAIFILGSISSL